MRDCIVKGEYFEEWIVAGAINNTDLESAKIFRII